MRRPKPKREPREPETLQVNLRLEEIPDTKLAADLARRILKAQALTAAGKERQNDAA